MITITPDLKAKINSLIKWFADEAEPGEAELEVINQFKEEVIEEISPLLHELVEARCILFIKQGNEHPTPALEIHEEGGVLILSSPKIEEIENA